MSETSQPFVLVIYGYIMISWVLYIYNHIYICIYIYTYIMISHGYIYIWLNTHDIIPVYQDEVVIVVTQKSGPSRIAEAQHHQFHKNHGDHVEQPRLLGVCKVSHDSQGFLEPIDFCIFLCDFCEKVCFPIFLGLCYI